MEKIRYYQVRLEKIQQLFIEDQKDLLKRNINKIRTLVEGYNEFKDHPDYNPLLSDFPKLFIFN